jgi:hypothetical protein
MDSHEICGNNFAGMGSATVSVAPSWRLANWLQTPFDLSCPNFLKLSDAFGGTPKAAVETTALPNSIERAEGWNNFAL